MLDETPNKLDHALRSGPGGAHVRWSMFGARGPLLNSESSGAGGGQSPAPGSPSPTTALFATPAPVPPAPATPPAPQDPGAATPQANGTDLATLLNAVTAMQQEVVTLRNAVYANQRRGGQPPPKKQESATDPNGAATPPATSTMDLARMRELDRAIARAGVTPDGAAYKRIERDFASENPDDAESWLTSYFEGLGIKPAQQQQPQPAAPAAPVTPATPPAPARPLVTNLGSPPAPQVPLEQQDLATMSLADKAELIRTKGASWFKQTLIAQQKGRQIKFG